MNEAEVTIYHLDEKEVHMVGDYVGVVWNTTELRKELIGPDGLTYRAKVKARDGKPYIDFVWIRGEGKDAWEDDDSPVAGGFGGKTALQVSKELALAVEYLARVEE
ncbi:MAG: hypothetical protein Q7O66_16855 [Dehalococcoidia bacterium]|nr:hypothetical protein [Dehalococcoidia bacterium]